MATEPSSYSYDAFTIRIEPSAGPRRYDVHCSGRTGEGRGSFDLPFDRRDLENFVLRMSRGRRATRHLGTTSTRRAEAFGRDLFAAVFAGEVRDLYRTAYADARRDGRGLRLTLQLTRAPELMDVPWEYLYDEPDFVSISAWTPVVRYLDVSAPRAALAVEPPLRVLGMVSDVADMVALDHGEERRRLETALAPLIATGQVELEWCDSATLPALLRALKSRDFHIFHFIGHGAYDEERKDGVLLLEDEHGRGVPVSGGRMGSILREFRTLRLAVLNACEGARTSDSDPFAGVAAGLVRRDMPAVVAMQFEITDEAALQFADHFYEALAVGAPVDAAIGQARRAVYASGNDLEWGTPVLFMRPADGRIFDVRTPEPMELPAPQPRPVAPEPRPMTPASHTGWFPAFAPWMLWGICSLGLFAWAGFLAAAAGARDRALRNWGLGYLFAASLTILTAIASSALADLVLENIAAGLVPVLWIASTVHAFAVSSRVERRRKELDGVAAGEEWFPVFAPWMLWGVASAGLLTGVGFLSAAAKSHSRGLRNWGLAYLLLAVGWCAGITQWQEGGALGLADALTYVAWAILWIGATLHALVVSPRVAAGGSGRPVK